MENQNQELTETKPASDRPVHIVRRGAVAASIWLRQSKTGGTYYEYTLSRSWKRKDGERQGYSPSFFSRSIGELSEVINETTRWIVAKEQAALAEDAAPELAGGVVAAW